MNYFDNNETIDYSMLVQFNEQTKMFQQLRPTKKGSPTDAVGKHYTKIGEKRTFNIELKHRYCSIDQYPTVYIEDYKMSDMLLHQHIFMIEPLYINFYNDGYVAIFNLAKLTSMPKCEIVNVYSGGKRAEQKQERRYCLDLFDACIYKDNKLVKPMHQKWQQNS